jgi:glucose-fructose oxidoreductase
MDDDASAIMDNTPLLAPGEEGLKDTIVVEAIYRSAASGEKVTIG